MPIASIAVFCGSRIARDPQVMQAARELGRGLAVRRIRLVYGGLSSGVMGALADAALDAGGEFLGVLPRAFTTCFPVHKQITKLVITNTIQRRKSRILDEADAYVSLPGGPGTLDETIEAIMLRQLRLHGKPIVLCNIGDSIAGIIAAIEATVRDGFAPPEVHHLYEVVISIDGLLKWLDEFSASNRRP